ncbi:hypothetical protein KCU95_g9842, partial [Aureobasidium melanogenum]
MDDLERLAAMETRDACNHTEHDTTDTTAPPVVQIPEAEMMVIMSKDPVLTTIFDALDKLANKQAATYIKLSFTKLAAIRELKEECREQADLLLSLQNMQIDTSDCTINATDGLSQKANKACRAMRTSNSNLTKRAATNLTQFIRKSQVNIPRVYRATDVDDLCAVWYAITSDRHHQCNEFMAPRIYHGFRVLVVTHLHLVGGTPSSFKLLQRPTHMSYQQFLSLLPDFLSVSRCKQAGHLGYSTKAPTTGPWKYQFASSLNALDPKHWEILSEPSYKIIKSNSEKLIFLIHAHDQAMPLRIAAKVQSRPAQWNSWSDYEAKVTTAEGPLTLPPPDFLPGPLDTAITAPVPTTAGPPVELLLPSRPGSKRSRCKDGQQGSKRARIEH